MNAFSKTEAPCDCGWLAQPLNDAESGISYDPEQNYIYFGGGRSVYPIYHCPFCGGAFPDSSEPIWVPKVPEGEHQRLVDQILGLPTVEEILARLGRPDYDAMTETYWERGGQLIRDDSAPAVRNIEYYHLSEWYIVEFYAEISGKVRSKIVVKPLSPKRREQA